MRILSHGQGDVEQELSTNDKLLLDNMREEFLIAQSQEKIAYYLMAISINNLPFIQKLENVKKALNDLQVSSAKKGREKKY